MALHWTSVNDNGCYPFPNLQFNEVPKYEVPDRVPRAKETQITSAFLGLLSNQVLFITNDLVILESTLEKELEGEDLLKRQKCWHMTMEMCFRIVTLYHETKAKYDAGHGAWGEFLKEHFDWMDAALPREGLCTDFGATKWLALLRNGSSHRQFTYNGLGTDVSLEVPVPHVGSVRLKLWDYVIYNVNPAKPLANFMLKTGSMVDFIPEVLQTARWAFHVLLMMVK